MASTERFQDRVSENPNRRKLNIISQTPNTIIADIERADTVVGDNVGTPISAAILNEWDSTVAEAKKDSASALVLANSANTTSEEALRVAQQSVDDATEAKNQCDGIKAIADGLIESPDCSQANNSGTAQVALVEASNGQKKFSFRNIKGEKGEGTFIRYSNDKVTMTDVPMDNSLFMGIYCGVNASNNAADYKWMRIWGTEIISLDEYKEKVTNGTVEEEQLYFIKGEAGETMVAIKNATDVVYDNTTSRLNANNVQDAIDELKSNQFSGVFSDLTGVPELLKAEDIALADLGERSYNSLTDKPDIPTNGSFTLAGLGEKSYNSLTDRPSIPLNSSFTLAGLGEKSYNSLTNKPVIPTNESFTLAGLSEKSYNSLTDKPEIPVMSRGTIAAALGLTEEQITQLVELAKITTLSGETSKELSFNVTSLNIQ